MLVLWPAIFCSRGPNGAVGSTTGRRTATRPHSLGLFEEIYQPSVSHVIEQQVTEETEADQTESGEEV